MKEQTCCFTGHRNVPVDKQKEIVARTGAKVRERISEGYQCFVVGGAVGYDTLAAELLFRLRDVEHMGIRVTLAYPFDGYTAHGAKNRKRPIHDCCHCTTSASVLPPRPAEGRIWRGTDTWWTSHPCASLTAHGRRAARPIPSGMPQKRECLSSMLQRIFDKGYARRP